MNKEDTPNNGPYDPDISELTLWQLFYGNKQEWYEVKDGKQDWSKKEKEVEMFWRAIREKKMEGKDFDFSDFAFPIFLKESFWLEGEEREFSAEAYFSRATFSAEADFISATFSAKASFSEATFTTASFSFATFSESADFRSATFSAEAYFSFATFSESADFRSATFSAEAYFSRATFKTADFHYTTFSAKAYFSRATFSAKADFLGATFSAMASFSSATFSELASFSSATFTTASFSDATFTGEAYFIKIEFTRADFSNTTFNSEAKCLFQEWSVENVVTFEDVIFHEKVQFQRCDMGKVEFKSCDLVKINFSNCRFPTNWFGRLAMKNDSFNKMADLAEMYRQLKRNRMEARDWTTAGDAYRSEMVMKLRIIGRSILRGRVHLIFSGLIISFHGLLSAFQQSLTRPLLWLAALLLAVPYKLHESDPDQGMYVAWKTSLDAALPVVGKIDVGLYDQDLYFLLVAERVMTIILLTFFGLGTRARLRQ